MALNEKSLHELLEDLKAHKLSWPTIRREKEMNLLEAIVNRLEISSAEIEPAKRGPGRPPKRADEPLMQGVA